MHDPLTMVRRLHVPFLGWELAQVWHRDPARGSDDSCGWFRPHLTKEQLGTLHCFAQAEARDPWFTARIGRTLESASDAAELSRGLVLTVATALGLRPSRRQIDEHVHRMVHSQPENARGSLAFVAGWHCGCRATSPSCAEHCRVAHAFALFCSVGRTLLAQARPWWRHPRWHLNHWEIRVTAWQRFRYRFLARCCCCHKRVAGASDVHSGSDGTYWHRGCVTIERVEAGT